MVTADRNFIAPFIYGFLLFGWFCAVVFSPVYLFDSGLPQISDFLLVGICGLCLCFYMATRQIIISDIGITLFLTVVLFAAINITYGIYYDDIQFYYSAAYYIFNAVVFAGTVLLFLNNPQRMKKIARLAVYMSVFAQILFIIFANSHSPYRETGSFNNPNQLGYWSLLNAALLIVLNIRRRITLFDLFIFCLCAVMIILSMSRAAIIAFAVLLCAVFFSQQLSLRFKSILFCVVTVIITCLFTMPEILPDNISRLSLSNIEDNFISERGYERISDNPQYLLYGAGEGAYWRFSDIAGTGIELHSGLATILFSYGILGAIFFTAFLYAVLRRSPSVIICGMVAIMMYGLTHQNIRFTGFWIYLAVIYAMTIYKVEGEVKHG